MHHKNVVCKVKAAGPADGLAEGEYIAVVSVFGNVDSYGDVVVAGAFADTLAEWKASGDPIPVYWSHQMRDPNMCIGELLDAKETPTGLEVHAKLDLDAPTAAQVYRLLKGRRVTQHSFSYDIVESGWAKVDGDEVYELRKLKLYEVGPTPIGANQETELLAIKAAGEHAIRIASHVKAGRVLSAANETTLREAKDALEGAVAQITNVLASVDGGQASTDSTAKHSEPAKDDEPTGGATSDPAPVKSDEPMRGGPAQLSELLAIELDAQLAAS